MQHATDFPKTFVTLKKHQKRKWTAAHQLYAGAFHKGFEQLKHDISPRDSSLRVQV